MRHWLTPPARVRVGGVPTGMWVTFCMCGQRYTGDSPEAATAAGKVCADARDAQRAERESDVDSP